MGLFSGLHNAILWNRLGLRLSHLKSAFIDFQKKEPMNYKQAILNTFKHFGYSVLTFAVLGTLQYLSNGDTLTKLLTHDGLPTTITVIAIPLVKDAIVLVQNFAKVHLVSE